MLDTLEDVFVPDPLQPATHGDIANIQDTLNRIVPMVEALSGMPDQMRRVIRVVDGVPEEDIKGLRPRVSDLEKKTEEYDRYVAVAKVVVPVILTIVVALLIEALRRYLGGP